MGQVCGSVHRYNNKGIGNCLLVYLLIEARFGDVMDCLGLHCILIIWTLIEY